MNQEKKSLSTTSIVLIIIISLICGSLASLGANFYLVSLISNSKAVTVENGTPKSVIEERTYVEESQTIDAIKKVSPAVVSIVATQDLKIYKNTYSPYFFDPFEEFPSFFENRPFFDNRPQENTEYEIRKEKVSGGSGFIISDSGLILTNGHVVSEKGVEYSVLMKDGTEYGAEVVSIDPLNDLAVLQMVKKGELTKKKEERTKLTNIPVAELGNSDALEIGQKVLAIGYALGEYENTVTTGIISGKSRNIVASGGSAGPERLSGLLQTDAAINFGNSGGPLVNLAGQVIGVNVAIDRSGQGIGFAIPMNDIKPILESIQKYGRIIRPSLGVRHMILTKEQAKRLEINVDHGALLTGNEAAGEFAVIPGSPADKAGLKMKDVILSVNGKDITIDYTLQDAIRNHKPGDEITMQVWRSGETLTLKAVLEEAKTE